MSASDLIEAEKYGIIANGLLHLARDEKTIHSERSEEALKMQLFGYVPPERSRDFYPHIKISQKRIISKKKYIRFVKNAVNLLQVRQLWFIIIRLRAVLYRS